MKAFAFLGDLVVSNPLSTHCVSNGTSALLLYLGVDWTPWDEVGALHFLAV